METKSLLLLSLINLVLISHRHFCVVHAETLRQSEDAVDREGIGRVDGTHGDRATTLGPSLSTNNMTELTKVMEPAEEGLEFPAIHSVQQTKDDFAIPDDMLHDKEVEFQQTNFADQIQIDRTNLKKIEHDDAGGTDTSKTSDKNEETLFLNDTLDNTPVKLVNLSIITQPGRGHRSLLKNRLFQSEDGVISKVEGDVIYIQPVNSSEKNNNKRSVQPFISSATQESANEVSSAIFGVDDDGKNSTPAALNETVTTSSSVLSADGEISNETSILIENLNASETRSSNISLTKLHDNEPLQVVHKLYKQNQFLKALLYHIAKTQKNPNVTTAENSTQEKLNLNLSNDTLFDNAMSNNGNDETHKSIGDSKSLNVTGAISNESFVYYDTVNNTHGGDPVKNSSDILDQDVNYDYDYSSHLYDYKVDDNVQHNTTHYSSKNKAYYNEPQPIISSDSEPLVDNFDPSLGSTIRKCCGPSQYFNLEIQDCADAKLPTNFRSTVQDLVLGDSTSTLIFKSGILKCPNPEEAPTIIRSISNYTHLLDEGYFYDILKEKHYDHELYCLELLGLNEEDTDLTAAVCSEHKSGTYVEVIRKCCPLDHYFDAGESKCVPSSPGIVSVASLTEEFSGMYTNDTIVETGKLSCQRGVPELADSVAAHFSSSDQLCVSPTGRCYPSSMYCIEYILTPGDYQLRSTAVYCPLDSFQKCCPSDEFMSEGSCVSTDEFHSPYVNQLMATLHYQVGVPIDDRNYCLHLLMNKEIRWWITNSGYLTIDVEEGIIETKNYCIEDWLEPNNEIITGAFVCSRELKESVQLPHSMFEEETVGKCCSPMQHLSPTGLRCVPGNSERQIEFDPDLLGANVTKFGYTGLPVCSKYHAYSFISSFNDDYVAFGSNSDLFVVSLDGECFERMTPLYSDSYCIDYGWDADDPKVLTAIVCVPEWSGTKLHTEKYDLVAGLLGVSCCSLLIAMFSLATMRVRRGLVSTRKMNTLAGRILMSYVAAHLIGFMTLAVSMHIDVEDNTTSCMILAGVMQFFLLAGFFWNTSICSESLLLTLRVSTSELRRFVYHSLWAWGVPALITAFCLLMDAFRRHLPCSTITPRIGRVKCFFSNPDAELLYFYLPIALTLVANLFLLLTSKKARLSKLKKLEKNKPKASSKIGTIKGSNNTQRSVTGTESTGNNNSGLRTHQNRNVVSESLRLVLWSGGTWLFEVVGFITARYISPPQERWYDYLWYIPATINSLRGFGIFFILVLTPETRSKIVRALGTFKGMSSRVFHANNSNDRRKSTASEANSRHMSMSMKSSMYAVGQHNPYGKTRNMSVATTLTTLPNLNNRSINENKGHPKLVHSISQMERRPSTTSTLSNYSDFEDLENIETVAASGRRRSNIAIVSLPSVDEDDEDIMESSLSTVPLPKASPTDSIMSYSGSSNGSTRNFSNA